MPRQNLMSWNKSQKRWEKMYHGERYWIVPTDLHCEPGDKLKSLDAANEWWKTKRAEIDGIPPTNRLDADSRRILDVADVLTLESTVKAGQQAADQLTILEMAQIKGKGSGNGNVAIIDLFKTRADLEKGESIPSQIIQHVLGGRSVEQSVSKLTKTKAAPERTVRANFDRYIAAERSRLGNDIGASRFVLNKTCLGHFCDWLGMDSDVGVIDEIKWIDWTNHVGHHAEWKSADHRKRHVTLAAKFVKFLWELRLLELPRNLESKKISDKRARVKAKREIKTVDVGTVRKLFGAATGQTRLHLLLMLNCGFTAIDINDLEEAEIDWRTGVIERLRSKTEHLEGSPLVRWKLWKRTAKLLREYRSGDSIVLKTVSDGRWITEEVGDDDKLKRSDMIASNFRYLREKIEVKGISPKQLRATAATVLGTHPQFKFYAQHFLAHIGETIADKHYVRPSEEEFFAALAWLESAILG